MLFTLSSLASWLQRVSPSMIRTVSWSKLAQRSIVQFQKIWTELDLGLNLKSNKIKFGSSLCLNDLVELGLICLLPILHYLLLIRY